MRLALLATAIALLCPVVLGAADPASPKPNFVIIFLDDLGYADIGPYGATKQRTPHLDRMAKEGMKLTGFLGYNLQAVRQGPWKLAIKPQNEAMGVKTEPDAAGTNPRLYNLDEDIGERIDLATKHPEIVARLQALANRMHAEIGGTTPSARRPAGEVAEAKPLYPMSGAARGKKPK